MKDSEILLILVIKFVHWVFKHYTKKTSRDSEPTTESITKKASPQYKEFEEAVTAQQVTRAYYPATNHSYISSRELSLGNRQSQKTIQPIQIQKKSFPGKKDSIGKKLTRYHRLHKAILIHELLAPKDIA